MMLQNLHNFSITGTISNSSLPTVLIGCSQSFYLIYISNSFFVNVANIMFKHCNILPKNITRTNLQLFCCFSCKIENVTLVQYGISGFNLIGRSYLNKIKVETMQFSKICCKLILLEYSICLPWHKYSNHVHDVTINQLFIKNYIACDTFKLHSNSTTNKIRYHNVQCKHIIVKFKISQYESTSFND